MITSLFTRPYYLRLAFGVLLVFFMGCKVVSPVYVMVKAAYKEIVAVLDTDEDHIEKTAGNDPSAKRVYEYLGVFDQSVSCILGYISIVHYTAYANNYQSSGYFKVAGPPPDFYLQSIA